MNDPAISLPARPMDETALGLPWLVADVGGTNARFGWVPSLSAGVCHVRKLPVAQFTGPAAAVAAYLRDLQPLLGAALATASLDRYSEA